MAFWPDFISISNRKVLTCVKGKLGPSEGKGVSQGNPEGRGDIGPMQGSSPLPSLLRATRKPRELEHRFCDSDPTGKPNLTQTSDLSLSNPQVELPSLIT